MARETHIFHVPHADDEILSMGAAVRHAVRAGHRVHAVLLTDGAADETLKCLNGEMFCHQHERFHDPVAEGFPGGIVTREDFIRARQREFLASATLLGIPRAHLRIHEYPDGGLQEKDVRRIILDYEEDGTLPGPKIHHAMTWLHDNHPDHLHSGGALHHLHAEGRIALEPWFYVKRWLWEDVANEPSVETLEADPNDLIVFQRIVEEVYHAWDPTAGVFGIGGHSVAPSFLSLLREPHNRRHR